MPVLMSAVNVIRTARSPDIPRLKMFFFMLVSFLLKLNFGMKKAPYFYDASQSDIKFYAYPM